MSQQDEDPPPPEIEYGVRHTTRHGVRTVSYGTFEREARTAAGLRPNSGESAELVTRAVVRSKWKAES